MAKTGFELPPLPKTGVDANTEQVKALYELHSETNKVQAETKQKLLEQMFSPNFLVFLVTVLVIASGFIFMSRENAAIDNIIKYWQMILPVVTTYIGYAVGKGKSKDS
ncbi:hypothetical protein GWZ74_15245 [Vibrio cholerae]|uniref:hypothetical protein n=1 Tax=Vibrio cholerae TaxID=666 RepID=UPI000F418001|nr:hypothetical protein [Vibrio cholerae]EGR4455355.1 hypothetical protein [Vibrio cholerae]NOE86631.1 hypothetical protein [Vibrio cholerae]NOE97230.1 hypothetical protein [Vibrio cholerae]NOE97944.1 hypothetical protein [Vibrio cholerae]NOF15669.1 hypothetical protein [Vibrio cholerae]